MRRIKQSQNAVLYQKQRINVRFSEVDSMNIVWHGNYMRFFEDGREAFGHQYGIGYLDIYSAGYTAPVVDLHCSFLLPLKYGETAVVETKYINLPSAKLHFEYNIFRESDNALVASGYSTQVFLDKEGSLQWNSPEFYLNWKNKWIREQ